MKSQTANCQSSGRIIMNAIYIRIIMNARAEKLTRKRHKEENVDSEARLGQFKMQISELYLPPSPCQGQILKTSTLLREHGLLD